MIEIKIYPDGDKTCAIIGGMPETVCIGFGDTARDAIVSMLDEMDRYNTFCPICMEESDERIEYETRTEYSCPNSHEWRSE